MYRMCPLDTYRPCEPGSNTRRSPVGIDCSITDAPPPPVLLKRRALPPGRTCGYLFLPVSSGFVSSGSGTPPAAVTRTNRLLVAAAAFGWSTIVLSSVQNPPRPTGASQRVTTAPPPIDTFFNLLPAKNAIHWPSGEKKGPYASSVPANAVA